MRTITRIAPNISYLNRIPNGVSESLKRALRSNMPGTEFSHEAIFDGQVSRAAAWFRSEYDKDQRDFGEGAFDIWEIAPLGRHNDSDGQWRWPTRDEFDGPIMAGFKAFVDDDAFFLDHIRRSNGHYAHVRASFGCPRKRLLGSDRRDFKRLPPCPWQFDDVSSRAPLVTKWLMKHNEQNAMLETVLTDNPAEPKKATRFVTFPGMEHVVQRVRASIVDHWVERHDKIVDDGSLRPKGMTPISGFPPLKAQLRGEPEHEIGWAMPERGYMEQTIGLGRPLWNLRLSLYLPSKDCETMAAATLARVLPLFVDVSVQGKLDDEYLAVIREWRDAGPARNTEGVR